MRVGTRKQIAAAAFFLLIVIAYPLLVDQGWFRYNPYVLPVVLFVAIGLYVIMFLDGQWARQRGKYLIQRYGGLRASFTLLVLLVLFLSALVKGFMFAVYISKTQIARMLERERGPSQNPPHGEVRPSIPREPQPPIPQKTPKGQRPSLPQFHKTDAFSTFVLFNKTRKPQPFLCPKNVDRRRLFACGEIKDVARAHLPDDEASLSPFLGTVLQHYLVSLVLRTDTTGSGAYGYTGSGEIIHDRTPPIDVPDAESHFVSQVLTTLSDRDLPLFPPSFSNTRIRLPKATKMSLIFMTAADWESHLGSYVVRLERTGFYKLDLHVTPESEFLQGALPENYQLNAPEMHPNIKAFSFRVEMDFTAERNADPRFVSEDYRRWAENMFTELRATLAN